MTTHHSTTNATRNETIYSRKVLLVWKKKNRSDLDKLLMNIVEIELRIVYLDHFEAYDRKQF